MRKIFTFLLALVTSVGLMNAKVTWNSSNISDLNISGTGGAYSKEGVTLSANDDHNEAWWYGSGDESKRGIYFYIDEAGGYTFSNTLGKNFTKIEMTLTGTAGWAGVNLGSGWLFSGEDGDPVTWTGNASTVDLLNNVSQFNGENVKSIVFYFEGDSEEPATPTVYNSGSVALSNLNVGDILMAGVTVTSEKADYKITLVANRLKFMNSVRSSDLTTQFSSINPVLGENAVILTSTATMFYTPIDEDGNIGNAWEVTANEVGTKVTLAGITYSGTEPASASPVTAARFLYNYDCQRRPAYPQQGSPCTLSGFSNPYVGYNGIGMGVKNTSFGPWKLEFVAYYTPSNNYGCQGVVTLAVNQYYSSLSSQEKEAKCLEVPIFRLWQYNIVAGEYQHAAYGIVCAYAAEGNAEDHGALFISSTRNGCFLAGKPHNESISLSCENDLTTGLNNLVTAASATDPDYDAYMPVILSIDAIGTVELTQHCKDFIEGSSNAYNALTDAQKGQVTNYQVLVDAKNQWAPLVAEAKPYADAVVDLINAIPNPIVYTQSCKNKIDAAQKAYDALTDGQKMFVSNYETLKNAPSDLIKAAPYVHILFKANDKEKKVENVTLPHEFTEAEMRTMLKELYGVEGDYDMFAYSNSDAVNISGEKWTIYPFMGKVNVGGGLNMFDPEAGIDDNIPFSLEITLDLPPYEPEPAQATENSITINGTPAVGDNSISLTYYFDPANVPGLSQFAPTLKVKCAADNKWDEKWLSLSEISSGTTTITLDELGSFQEGKSYDVCFAYYNGGWVDEVFQSFTPATPEPGPQGQTITGGQDPQNTTYYYCTFFDSQVKYALPAGVEAYVATISGDALTLTKIAVAGQTIPANNAVIFRANAENFTLTPSTADAVTISVTNDLKGTDVAVDAIPANCYVLSDEDDVIGFYEYNGNQLNAHKAYIIFNGSSSAPRRMRFIFAEEQNTTALDNAETDNMSVKVIENGQLVIIRNGVRYNAAGQVIE